MGDIEKNNERKNTRKKRAIRLWYCAGDDVDGGEVGTDRGNPMDGGTGGYGGARAPSLGRWAAACGMHDIGEVDGE